MVREKSVGFIIYREHPQEGVQYLFLYHRGTYWNFPKGRVEEGEREMQTGRREVSEETGINKLTVVGGWRQQTHFFFKEKRGDQMELIRKDFVLYLAGVSFNTIVKLSPEHNGFAWFDYATAVKYARFKNLKLILAEAQSTIEARRGHITSPSAAR